MTVLTTIDEPIMLPPHLAREPDKAIDEAEREAGGPGLAFIEGLKRYG